MRRNKTAPDMQRGKKGNTPELLATLPMQGDDEGGGVWPNLVSSGDKKRRSLVVKGLIERDP